MPYGVYRFNQIVEECYYISKYMHTSYLDLMSVSVGEKNQLLNLINDENKRNQEELERARQKARR